MSYSKKPMAQWKDKDVKAWVNSLDGFNDKQKKLICKGVDEIGCDGDSLESAETAEELKDALDIPIILARKLHRKVTAFKDKEDDGDDDDDDSDDSGDDDDDSDSDSDDSDDEPKKKKKKKGKNKKAAKKSKKGKKKKKQESSDESSSDSDSSSDDSSDDEDGGDDNEEDVLARLIARNLAKKNKIQPGSSKNADNNNSKKKGGFLQWGSNNNNNNGGGSNNFGGSSEKFIVNIQGSNGKYIQISTKCDKHTSVKQVKQYLAAQEGGDPSKMNLKFNGRNMDDHQNLGFYGIANSRNLITVSYKVVGGN